MASSDDEEELVPQSVTNYYFEDAKEEPISFSILPILLDDTGKPDASREQVFLRGTGDDGLQKIYKQVTAWKLELEDAQPEIMVLMKDNKWIKLLKPRKSYEVSIRTILITVQLVHFLRRKPESSEKSLWDHLRKMFSSFEDGPSVNDLTDHYPLIKLLVERDDALAKSQLLLMLLKERPRKSIFSEDLQNDSDSKKPFIVDDDLEEDIRNDDGDESEEEPDLFDSVCAICDNGGELLCCEGRCMRSFHATRKDGEDSDCRSLGFSRAQVEAIQNFLCKNCKYKQHQCFVCGKLGSSDKLAGAEVFPCINATCGYFYHPKCVADLLFQENKAEAAEYEKKIAAGESFACPVHKCHVCKQGENKEVEELQFAVCRRCPKSYHKKCLPKKIAFEDIEEEGIIQRAWEDLLPNRILIYCLKHKIDEDLGTPMRNHIIFPEIPEKKRAVDVQKSKGKVPVKKIRQVSDDLSQEWTSIKPKKATEKLPSSRESPRVARSGITQQVLNFQRQLIPLKVSAESDLDSKKSPKQKENAATPTVSSAYTAKITMSSYPKIDVETEKKMIAFMESTSSTLTLEDILKKRIVPSTHSHTARNTDRTITLGKVEGSVEAVKTALRKLEDGGTVEDAKAVCEPDVLKQLMRWNNKLKVYLAPFLHGMRYTSFGRHFTKVTKLVEIVDKLQWYVQQGDMIVDFCCGANDFSRLMKEKLDAAGKKCSFKNYDVMQPKYDFNFEKRDWMSVQPRELPPGSQLIMGLNPPFGVKASLANKFIDKALTFKPKLLILIVPSEAERLDQKRSPYDLIWEDCEKLSGKSFYLPGSVDVNDMQIEQWNVKPPPLYLWSRPDWTSKHRAIALKQGHISQVQREPLAEEESQAQRSDLHPPEDHISKRHENKEAIAPEVTIKEGNNKDIAAESKKRSPPENHNTGSSKRRKAKRKEREEGKRKEQEEAKRKEKETADGRKEREEGNRKEQEEAKREEKETTDKRKGDELSDMSISPPNTRDFSGDASKSQLPLEKFETPREFFRTSTERPSNQRPGLEFGAIPEGGRASSVVGEDIDDIARRYTTPSSRDALFTSSSHSWSGDRTGNRDYLMQNPEEGYSGLEPFSRNSYGDDYRRSLDVDTRMLPSRPYSLQGEGDSLERSRFSSALGHNDLFPPSSYGLSSSMAGSVMDRYAPRLDETNIPGGPGNRGQSAPFLDTHGMRRDMPPDYSGFAPGPQNQFHRNNTGSWLDD